MRLRKLMCSRNSVPKDMPGRCCSCLRDVDTQASVASVLCQIQGDAREGVAAPEAWMVAVQLLCWAQVLQLQASQYWAGMPERYQQPPGVEVRRQQAETAPPAAAEGHAVAGTAPLLSASIAWPPTRQVGLQDRSWSGKTGIDEVFR